MTVKENFSFICVDIETDREWANLQFYIVICNKSSQSLLMISF